MVLLALWGGCGGEPECATGFSAADDGLCYQEVTGVALDDLFAALPACELADSSDRLDLEGGCADGVCLGQTLSEAEAGFGEPSFCAPAYQSDFAVCFFGEWILASVADPDNDGVPDEGVRIYDLDVVDGWDGSSTDGLAHGQSMACWIEILGTPTQAVLAGDGDRLPLVVVEWAQLYLTIGDGLKRNGTPGSDGNVDSISFENRLYY